MATDIFLKIGDIKGESIAKGHENEINVTSWNWGMTQTTGLKTASGAAAGKVQFQDITISKHIDKSSPSLVLACCSGKRYPDATLVLRKAGTKPVEYLKIIMRDVVVSSVAVGASSDQDKAAENITLDFAEFKVEYTSQNKDGSAGEINASGWNIPKNTKV
jgi:type VI secretion system secreted protein Hcp